MSNGPWTDAENNLIVADYFAMLADDVAGRPYNKAEHNRDLQTRIDRNRSADPVALPLEARALFHGLAPPEPPAKGG